MTNGLSHSYHLDESAFIYTGIGCNFSFFISFVDEFPVANGIAPDGMPRFAASHLGLFCLHVSHKRTSGLHVYRWGRVVTNVASTCDPTPLLYYHAVNYH